MLTNRTIPARKLPERTTVAGNDRTTISTNESDTVTTATLVRGKTYVYRGVHYKKDIPIVLENEISKGNSDLKPGEVSEAAERLAKELEELFQEVHDADREIYEKPYFDIVRNVPRPTEEVVISRRRLPARRG